MGASRDNFEKTYRFMYLIAGLERSGKTYFSEKLANRYALEKGPVIAYNAGDEEDFSDYEYIEPVDPYDMPEYMNWNRKTTVKFNRKPQITHFKYREKIYHFKDFNLLFANRGEGAAKLKMFSLPDTQEQNMFFHTVFKYLSGCLIILDDIRSATRSGLTKHMCTAFSRKNHCGKQSDWKREGQYFKGCDFVAIYHNLDKITPEMYDYATSLIMFKCNQIPEGKSFKNDQAKRVILKCYDELNNLPEYTAKKINLRGPERMESFTITPQTISKL